METPRQAIVEIFHVTKHFMNDFKLFISICLPQWEPSDFFKESQKLRSVSNVTIKTWRTNNNKKLFESSSMVFNYDRQPYHLATYFNKTDIMKTD